MSDDPRPFTPLDGLNRIERIVRARLDRAQGAVHRSHGHRLLRVLRAERKRIMQELSR